MSNLTCECTECNKEFVVESFMTHYYIYKDEEKKN